MKCGHITHVKLSFFLLYSTNSIVLLNVLINMKFNLSSLILIPTVTKNYWILKLSFYVENIINGNKITLPYYRIVFYLFNKSMIAIHESRGSTSSPFGALITTELSSSGF